MPYSRSGFGLVQALIAAGVVSGLMLSTTAFLSHTQRSQKSVQMSSEWTRRADLARAFLSNQETCSAWITGSSSFQQASVSFPNLVESVPSSESAALTVKQVSSPTLEIYVHDKTHDGVHVTDIKFWKVEVFGPSSFLAQVAVLGKKLASAPEFAMPGQQNLRSDFYLQVQLTSSGTFQSCQGTTLSDACAAMGGTFEVGASPECVMKQMGIAENSTIRQAGLNRLNWAAANWPNSQGVQHGLYSQGGVLSDGYFSATAKEWRWLYHGQLVADLEDDYDFGATIGLERAGKDQDGNITDVKAGDVLSSIVTRARSGGAWGSASDAHQNFTSLIQVKASSGWSGPDSHPTDIHFFTTPAGSNNYKQAGAPAMTIRADQSLAVKGSVKIGAAPAASCDAAAAGTTRYSAALKALELCDGSQWKPLVSGIAESLAHSTCVKREAPLATKQSCGTISKVYCAAGEVAVSGGMEQGGNLALQNTSPILNAQAKPIGWQITSYATNSSCSTLNEIANGTESANGCFTAGGTTFCAKAVAICCK